MGTENPSFSILMFPWIAHGHIFPYLELAKALLHRKKFHIHLCTTPINFPSINNFIITHSLHHSLSLVDLDLQPSPHLPPRYHTTKNLPPSLMNTLIRAFQMSSSSFSDIIATIKPDLVIYDMFQPWAAKIPASQAVPSLHFSIFSAAPLAFMHHRYTLGEAAAFPFPAMHFEDHQVRSLLSTLDFLSANIHDADDQDFLFGNFNNSREIVLIKTSRAVEGKYVDYLSTLSKKKIVPVAPLINHSNNDDDENSEVMKWLSKKSKHSTVFISFGSAYFLSEDEIEEIAKALELCSVNFIWIIRSPKGGAEAAPPPGFVDRVGDRGIVVSGWAAQTSILAHENTGCFVSHCGWSSIMESMYFGVPVVAMAMKVDQPVNGRMLAEAGSCVEVSRKDGEVFKAEEIAKAIERVMAEEELRRCARRLSAAWKMGKNKCWMKRLSRCGSSASTSRLLKHEICMTLDFIVYGQRLYEVGKIGVRIIILNS